MSSINVNDISTQESEHIGNIATSEGNVGDDGTPPTPSSTPTPSQKPLFSEIFTKHFTKGTTVTNGKIDVFAGIVRSNMYGNLVVDIAQ